jgi:hypothetical protein
MNKRKEFKAKNIQDIMTEKREKGILLLFGWIFTILGIISLFLYYIIRINLVIGNVIINTNSTGMLMLIIGVLSLLLHYFSK